MKAWLINLVKYSKIIYNIYFFLGSLFIKFLGLFVKLDDKIILFSSFGGRKFDDSPRVLYESMINDQRFNGYKIIWAFRDPRQFNIPFGEKISTDGLKYHIMALKARLWITNSSIERGLYYKRKSTFCFNTWHGSPIKKMGSDLGHNNTSFKAKGKNTTNIMTAQSRFDVDVFSRVFNIPIDDFAIIGLPRNDLLANYQNEYVNKVKTQLCISSDKKVILYAPTFREYIKSSNGVDIKLPVIFEKWQNRLGDKYVLLFRAHYEVAKSMNIEESEFIIDVSSYPVLNDLMIASDILISDYSSIFFDYSIMDKPMLHFCYDYDLYEKERGMYFDIREWLPGAENEDDLLDLLFNLNYKKSIQNTISFRNKYVTAYGNASKQSLDIIAKELEI